MRRNSRRVLRELKEQGCTAPYWDIRLLTACLLLAAFVAAGIWAIHRATGSYLGTASVLAAFGIWIGCASAVQARRLRALAASRASESICGFARSFPRRSVEPLLLRAVYEAVQEALGTTRVPVRADDRFTEDLRLDDDDIVDIYLDVAGICGRSTDEEERNPFYGGITSVADLVRFLQNQPRLESLQ